MSRVIGQDLQASGVAQVIVVLKRPPQVGAAAGGAAAGVAPRGPMMDVPMHGIERHFRTSELSQDSALAASSLTAANATEPTVRYYPNLGVAFGTVDRAGLAALRADPAVASVQGAPKLSLIAPERIADAKLTVNRTWGLTALKAPDLWAKGFTGSGILVGHLDTGVDGKHPALKNAIGHYAEFDLLGGEITPTPAPRDSGEHGTHTAATIAGRPVQGRSVGMAPDAKLASAMVIEGGNAVARVLGGMDWAVGLGVNVLEHVARVPRLVGGLHPDRADPAPPPGAAGLRGRQRGAGHEPVARQLPAGAVGRGDGQEPLGRRLLLEPALPAARATRSCPTSSGRGSASRPPSPAAAGRTWTGRRWRRRTSPGSPRCSCRPGRRHRSAGSSGRSSSRARSIRRCRAIARTAACPMASRRSPC